MIIETPTSRRTTMEVYKMLNESALARLINGRIFLSLTPTNRPRVDPFTNESIVYQLENNQHTMVGKETSTLFSPLFNHSCSF